MAKTKLKHQLNSLRQQHRPAHKQSAQNKPQKLNRLKQEEMESPCPSINRIYQTDQKILLVGEANFSFSRALLRHFRSLSTDPSSNSEYLDDIQSGDHDLMINEFDESSGIGLLATTLDSDKITTEKYPDAAEIVDELKQANVSVLFEIDATDLPGTLQRRYLRPDSCLASHPVWSAYCRGGKSGRQAVPLFFDVIIFNFPHCGRGITDQDRNIRANQELLLGFMRSASQFLNRERGQIHITLKQGEPYDSWKIKALAKTVGLRCLRSYQFQPLAYDGYAHRRTLGFQPGLSSAENEELTGKQCRTFIFCPAIPHQQQKQQQPKKRKRNDGNEDDSD